MSNQRSWKERWKEKDLDGDTVADVAMWSDGTAALYKYRQASGYERNTINVTRLIPIKPAPVVVPWEPDEVPVGAVVRHIGRGTTHVITGSIFGCERDEFEIGCYGRVNTESLRVTFVLHQPKVDTKDCQPCGKVVQG